MSYAGLLDQVAEHQRASVAQSAEGDTTHTWVVLDTEAPCSIQRRGTRGRTYLDGGWHESADPWQGFFAPDQDLRTGDRIVADGVTYEVAAAEVIRGIVCQTALRILGAV